MKIDENSQCWQGNSSELLNVLRNFNETFRKDVAYDDTFSEKPQVGQIDSPPQPF